MEPLAFICAMSMELKPLVKRLGLKPAEIGGVELRRGELDGSPVIAYMTGMGTKRATGYTDRLLAAVRPHRVVVFGVAGAVDDETPIGSVVRPATVIDQVTGRTHENHLPGGGPTRGAMWTTDVITKAENLPVLIGRGVIALDMETAAIAQCCEREGIPWSVHRAISDRATDGSVTDEVFHLSDQDGTPNGSAVTRYVLRHPQKIPGMVKMARGFFKATERSTTEAIAAARASYAAS